MSTSQISNVEIHSMHLWWEYTWTMSKEFLHKTMRHLEMIHAKMTFCICILVCDQALLHGDMLYSLSMYSWNSIQLFSKYYHIMDGHYLSILESKRRYNLIPFIFLWFGTGFSQNTEIQNCLRLFQFILFRKNSLRGNHAKKRASIQ